ncbi:MAG TPA: FtsX-like permease family protein [Gaiellaceae bacterium]
MLRLAILTARKRLGTFLGAFLALAGSAVLVTAGGMLLQSALRSHPPVTRYAAAAAIVAGHQDVGPDRDVILDEPVRVRDALVERLARVAGVRAAIADSSVVARLGAHDVQAHSWSSARLAPYRLVAGRPPAAPNELVVTQPLPLGTDLRLTAADGGRTATVVGVARAPRAAPGLPVVFLTDSELVRLAGHPGRVDAIGVLAAPGFDPERLRAAAGGAVVLTGAARSKAESVAVQSDRTQLIAVAASFGGLGMFIAIFVVAGTMALVVQQREQEIALLRAVAATPGQVRRMIAWEAAIVSLLASASGVVPGAALGRALARGFVRHSIAPPSFTVGSATLPAVAAVGGGVLVALFAVYAAGRRVSRVAPTSALAEAAVEPRAIGLGRLIGGGISIAAAVPLFSVANLTHSPQTAAATSEMTALFLVAAVGFLGPLVALLAAFVLAPPLSRIAPVGGFLASANLRAATRRFSSATTPLVLSVALSCTLLFSSTTTDHAVKAERTAGLAEDLAVSTGGVGLPPAALKDVRATRGVASAVALTPTELGPGGIGVSDDVTSAQVLDGGAGGGLDVGVVAGSLARLHGAAIALSRTRADGAHAHLGDRVSLMLGDATRTHARVVAIYTRGLGFGDALLAPELAAGHLGNPLAQVVLVRTAHRALVAPRLRRLARRYPGLRVTDRAATLTTADDADRATNHWLTPLFVTIIFAFTSISVVNTLAMIGLRRGRELALLRLTGATRGQVRSMARWEAVLIVTIGVVIGLAISATALLPLSHALTGGYTPYVRARPLAAILGGSAVLSLLAIALPTRRALRSRPIATVGVAE